MVGDYYSIATSDIKGDSRKKEHSLARQMLMYIAKKHFSRTLEKIGDYFGGKNHATVIYAIKNFEKIMKSDAQIAKDYAMIAEQMNS
ncbi:MAG TPA: helix-turn-helix domain-containing protein [Candidatus Absconditabacterales bacterium]|nr:helix-turn-helix domain-containing protein [Candidatus Absconditabacterales bacterium]